MEISPTFLLSAAVGLISLIGYLVQLKPKLDRLEAETKELWSELQSHKEKESIHFNEKVNKQVEEKYNQRFQTIESTLGKMDEKIEKKFELLNTKLDKVLDKK
jgi:hypothetical protein